MKKIFLSLLVLIVLISVTWFLNQEVTEGYVYETYDSSLLVIELSDSETEGKTQEEIMGILEKKASEPSGNNFDIPLINRALDTDFEAGQKVKVHWTGDIKASLPGTIDGTMLIMKDD